MHAVRNVVEFCVLIALWIGFVSLESWSGLPTAVLLGVLFALSWSKTAFFGIENLQQLLVASHHNVPYYKFMVIMLVNMAQIITSFAFDYHCLHQLNAASFGGIDAALSGPALVFEYLYYSVLTFTFFGYGDMTPQTVPAKLLTMTEILVAFSTVIFLLSDFISLKESVSNRE
jgi:hypothetical protein